MRRTKKTPAWMLVLGLGTVVGCGDDASDPGTEPRYSITAARLLSTGSPTKDEDPSVLRAADGSMFVAWFSDRDDGAGDIYLVRTQREANWSSAIRVTDDPGGDFYPSLIQDAAGTFHLTWFRWYALMRGHILHSTSNDGVSWSVANEESVTTDPDVDDWLPTPAIASDGTMFIYFISDLRDAVNVTSEIYVVAKGPSDINWSAPVPVTGINSASEHDQLPFVARTGSGFTMVWVRHDTSQPKPWLNPKSQLFLATSTDGLAWSTPLQVTNDAGNVVHLFPSIVTPESGQQSILWLSNRDGVARPYELLVANVNQYPATVDEVNRLGDGYSHRMAETPVAGLFLGAWVDGPVGAEEVYYRFFER